MGSAVLPSHRPTGSWRRSGGEAGRRVRCVVFSGTASGWHRMPGGSCGLSGTGCRNTGAPDRLRRSPPCSGHQIVAQRPGDAFLLAAVAVRRIENLEKFNEIILELKRRPHGGRKALFCVYLLKETRFIRCRYYSSFSRLASGTVPVRGRGEMKFCGE